jgi:hypothetical protein
MTTDYNRGVALRCVDAGLYVLPCNPTTKRALVQEWQNCATNHRNGVAYFWNTRPGAIVGIACRKSGLVVLDCDRNHGDGADGIETFKTIIDTIGGGEFPDFPATWTPSGGLHIITKHPMGHEPLGDRVRVWPGVDIRAAGYFIAPGCVKSDGTLWESVEGYPDFFEWYRNNTTAETPAWLAAQIARAPAPDLSERAPCEGESGDEYDARCRKWGLGALNNKARELAQTVKGGRNHQINRAAFVLGGKSLSGRLNESEVRAALWDACKVNGYLDDPEDGPDAFHRSFESGWRDGLAKPLPGPRERYVDDGKIIIDIKPKAA